MTCYSGCWWIAVLLVPILIASNFHSAYYQGGWAAVAFRNVENFKPSDIPDLSGKVAIVTGGNTGIGLASVKELARRGARVILTARNEKKAEAARVDVLSELGENAKVDAMRLDLSSFQSIQTLADDFKNKQLPLHILLLNAGVMMCPFALTDDGFEMQFGTNHLGHFLLTSLLLDVMVTSAPGRIVSVSSVHHHKSYLPQGVRFDQLDNANGYDHDAAYGQSKLANVLFAKALDKRLRDKGILANAVHPGLINTDLFKHVEDIFGQAITRIWQYLFWGFHSDTTAGALAELWPATSPSLELGGRLFLPIAVDVTGTWEEHYLARNVTLQDQLWTWSEAATKTEGVWAKFVP